MDKASLVSASALHCITALSAQSLQDTALWVFDHSFRIQAENFCFTRMSFAAGQNVGHQNIQLLAHL